MTAAQKEILFDAWDWCDEEDKSTEFMLSYMADMAGIDYDTVVDVVCDNQMNLERLHRWKQNRLKNEDNSKT